jgi:hypothetical protein
MHNIFLQEVFLVNINFHYFTIKALARISGFDEMEAQLIAEYSQFVDDFHQFLEEPIKCSCVPESAKFLCKDIYDKELDMYVRKFIPVNTGFAGANIIFAASKTLQENALIPFHFIPEKQLNYINNKSRGIENYRVKKMQKTSCLLKSLLDYTAFLYKNNIGAIINLIRIGIVVHIFADTYSHQKFSGYWGWENSSRVIKVIDNLTKEDITAKYRKRLLDNLPAIGHANVNTVPDDSNISFTINFKIDKNDSLYMKEYSRDNTKEFLIASINIINYLRYCKGNKPISKEEWNILKKKLIKGFLFPKKSVSSLTVHWSEIFNEFEFYYDERELNKPSDNFFDFNICAYEFKEIILGNLSFPNEIFYSNN